MYIFGKFRANPATPQDVRLALSQAADGIITSIDQGTGTGNFVAIIQDATVNAAPIAYVSQAGNGNFAVAYQH